MLVLIWVQTVCKRYQQMTKAAASKERVKGTERNLFFNAEQKKQKPFPDSDDFCHLLLSSAYLLR